jgi:hypothetical protein
MFCINFGTHGFYSLLFRLEQIDPPDSIKLQALASTFGPAHWIF